MSKTRKKPYLGRIPIPEKIGKIIKSKKEKYLKQYLENEIYEESEYLGDDE